MKPHFFSSTHKSPFWVLLAVCFCISAPASKADLSSAELTSAILDALAEYRIIRSDHDTVATSPLDQQARSLSRYLVNDGTAIPNSIGLLLSRIALVQSNQLEHINSGLFDVRTGLPFLGSGLFDSATYQPYLGQFIFSDEGDLFVWDTHVVDAVNELGTLIPDAINSSSSDLQSDLHGAIDDAASSVSGSLGDLADDLTAYLYSIESHINDWYFDWREVRGMAEEADDDTDNVVSSSEDESLHDEENVERDVVEDYELTGLPDTPYSYQPEVEVNELQGQDLGLSSLSGASDHNALITLVSRSDAQRGPIPQIEVDFGANDELVDGAGRISSFLAWMYRTLGALFLGLKGIHMWRVCYTSTIQAATGNDPIVQLAWNPF